VGRTVAIVPATGSGERLGAEVPKSVVRLGGVTLIERTAVRAGDIAVQSTLERASYTDEAALR
jgi:2-C-methyl-D-erythritol 4-phosphate cytidylyltransferase